MKIKFCLLITVLIVSMCNSQTKTNFNVWLCEPYINALERGDSNAINFAKPILALTNPFGKCVVTCPNTDARPIKTKKIKDNGKEKVEILDLAFYIGVKSYNIDYAESFRYKKVYISMEGEKLKLEIISKNTREEILFVDHYKDYVFKDSRKAHSELWRRLKKGDT